MAISLSSEKKSLFYFLSLYIFLTFIIFALDSYMYYTFKKELALNSHLPKLQDNAKSVIRRIRQMHESLLEDNFYPRYSTFKSAIYDADFNEIFSLLDNNESINFKKILYKEAKYIYFIKEPELYYLGTKYVIIRIKDDEKWLMEVYKNIAIYGTLFLFFMAFLGYYLVKLFLRPMKESITLLNNFIKDTTHELNTPVSTILTNIESMKTEDKKILKKIKRIEIAARTISNIYEDLTYLLLSDKIPSKIERIDIKEILKQRVEYFKALADSKKIEIKTELNPSFLRADKKKIARVIDNLLSNAIKYNKIGGTIEIKSFKGGFSIKDNGIGIKESKLKEIFDRYKRLSESEGGFGIGLNIVLMITKEFGLKISIDSEENRYTKVTIRWEK